MDAPQAILLAVVLLVPIVLMVEFWGDERLTFRGRPVPRRWRRQVHHATDDHPSGDEH